MKNSSCDFDAETERCDIQEQHIFGVAGEDRALNRGAGGDHFVGVDAGVRLFAEDVCDDLPHLGHAGHATDQQHLIEFIGR